MNFDYRSVDFDVLVCLVDFIRSSIFVMDSYNTHLSVSRGITMFF